MATYRFLEKYHYINPLIITPRDNVLVTRAANNQVRSVVTNGEYFEFTITLEPVMLEDPTGFSDLLNHRTMFSTHRPFDMPCPQPTYNNHDLDTLSNATVLRAGTRSDSVRINKSRLEMANAAGRFVKFDNRSKIYQIHSVQNITGDTQNVDLVLYPTIQFGELDPGQRTLEFHSFNMRVTYINTGTFSTRTNNRGEVNHTMTVVEYLE